MTGTLLQEFDDSKVKNFWRRNKKATVDLELPVAVDRQLEDQKAIMEYNRTPAHPCESGQGAVGADHREGHTRDVTIKAKAVNEIVRDASGVHIYVIVPPLRCRGCHRPRSTQRPIP